MNAAAPARIIVATLIVAAVGAAGQNSAPTLAQTGSREWVPQPIWQPSYDQGALLDPMGVAAAPGDRFYVVDRGHDRVAIVDGTGGITGAMGVRGNGPGELREPTDVAVDAARDRVYVVDRGNKRVQIFDLAGAAVESWTTAGPDFSLVPLSVAVHEGSGHVYVLSTSIVPRIERYEANGTWLEGWGRLGLGTGDFIAPQDVGTLADGSVLVADAGNGRVHRFGPDGSSPRDWAILTAVRSVSRSLADGRVYTLSGLASDRLSVHDASGTLLNSRDSFDLPEAYRFRPGQGIGAGDTRLAITAGYGAPTGEHGLRQLDRATLQPAVRSIADPRNHAGFFRPEALDVDTGGRVYLADAPIRVVKRFDENGVYVDRVETGAASDLTVASDGTLFTADVYQFVRLRAFSQAGTWLWDKGCDCLSGIGLAPAAQRIYATDAVSTAMRGFDLNPDNEAPIATVALTGAPFVWPLDLDAAGQGKVLALDSLGRRVHVVDPPSGLVESSFSLPGSAHRLSVAGDGTIFVLFLDSTVGAFSPTGTLIARWSVEAAPGTPYARPKDIAAAPDATVYVLDGASNTIRPYAPRSAPPETSEPPPTADPGCTATGTKTAAPRQISLADTTTVTLTLDITCRSGSETRADIVLIIDRSSSMDSPGCSKLCEAKAAAKSFVAGIDLQRHRIGLVTFSETVTLDLALSSDRAVIDAAIDRVQPAGNTNIAGALDTATVHVLREGRQGALPVYLLLTDGEPSGTEQAYPDSVIEGLRAAALGGIVYSIGLGTNVRTALLESIAGTADRYFFAPTGQDLRPIYDRLSETIGDITAANVEITDEMGPDVEYVPGTATGGAQQIGNTLVWRLGVPPVGGVTFRYEVRPLSTGLLPTNREAIARYDVEGATYRFVYPIPEIEVLDVLTPTVTPPPTATPTPTATPLERAVYLPLLMKGLCLEKDRRLGADIVLVIDVSSSMTGEKLAGAIEAAQEFVRQVDGRRDRVGVVSFDADAHLVYLVTANLTAVHNALATLKVGEGTRIDLGLSRSLDEFGHRGREGSQRVIILLSDGVPTMGTAEDAVGVAARARAMGISLFSIGLGADADMNLLERISGRGDRTYFARGPEDLIPVYTDIAANIPCR
jgi:Mg-chelatase subunit ChlD/DNA-binding beta-propeller fold protein YncE